MYVYSRLELKKENHHACEWKTSRAQGKIHCPSGSQRKVADRTGEVEDRTLKVTDRMREVTDKTRKVMDSTREVANQAKKAAYISRLLVARDSYVYPSISLVSRSSSSIK